MTTDAGNGPQTAVRLDCSSQTESPNATAGDRIWVGWIHRWSHQVGHFLAAYSSSVQNRAKLYKVLYKHIARNKSASISLLFQ